MSSVKYFLFLLGWAAGLVVILSVMVAVFDYSRNVIHTRECDERGELYQLQTKAIGNDCYFLHNDQWLDKYDLKRVRRGDE